MQNYEEAPKKLDRLAHSLRDLTDRHARIYYIMTNHYVEYDNALSSHNAVTATTEKRQIVAIAASLAELDTKRQAVCDAIAQEIEALSIKLLHGDVT